MPRKKKVTLQHLADELGLTIQTVSKALRGLPGMSEETRQEVRSAAVRLGYRTLQQLQQLNGERIAPYPVFQRRFLLIQSEVSLPFNRLLLQGLHERFAEFGHRIEPLLLPAGITAAELGAWVEEHAVLFCDGIFIAPRLVPDFVEERLLELPIPRMLLNFPPPEARVDSVVWDVYEAVRASVRHLLRMGHRRIMYAGDIRSQRGYILRWQAFGEALRESGLELVPEEHCTEALRGGEGLELFVDRFERSRPTAVICGIDEEVAPVYHAVSARCRIPEDCSLIGFLNEQPAHLPLFTRPGLPIRETGYRAADRLLWRLANPQYPYEHVRIQGELYRGNTVSKPVGTP